MAPTCTSQGPRIVGYVGCDPGIQVLVLSPCLLRQLAGSGVPALCSTAGTLLQHALLQHAATASYIP